MIIQPLVENAILHGLKNRREPGGLLVIHIRLVNDNLQYEIIDNGIGLSKARQKKQSGDHSYGMDLTRSRIKLFNRGTNNGFDIEDAVDHGLVIGTKATVTLKLTLSAGKITPAEKQEQSSL